VEENAVEVVGVPGDDPGVGKFLSVGGGGHGRTTPDGQGITRGGRS
jgi:hypothetical protein